MYFPVSLIRKQDVQDVQEDTTEGRTFKNPAGVDESICLVTGKGFIIDIELISL